MIGIEGIENPTEEQFENFFKNANLENKIIKHEKLLFISKAWNKYLSSINYSMVYTYNNSNIFQNNIKVCWNEVLHES